MLVPKMQWLDSEVFGKVYPVVPLTGSLVVVGQWAPVVFPVGSAIVVRVLLLVSIAPHKVVHSRGRSTTEIKPSSIVT